MKTEKRRQKTEETKSHPNLSRSLRFLLSDAFSSISDYQRRLAVPPRFSRFPAFRFSAFTLIEMVGVMAVLAILAAAIVPVAVRQSDKGALANESSYVSSISNALAMQIIRGKTVPDETTWTNAASSWMMLPASQIAANGRNIARAFLIDTGGWFTNYPAGSLYVQSASGTYPRPVSARAMILSSIARDLPVATGRPSSASFSDIWNTPPLATPSTWTWNGSGGDLSIQRFNLDPLFHHLMLINRDVTAVPAFSIDSTAPAATVALTNSPTGWESYYLDGTVVGLWAPGSVLTNNFVLKGDVSYTFDAGMWRAQLNGGGTDNSGLATNFAAQAALFVKLPTGDKQGSDPLGVLSAFYSFMYAYTTWANECPHFQTLASSLQQPADYNILDAMGGKSQLIDKTTGSTAGGLLKGGP